MTAAIEHHQSKEEQTCPWHCEVETDVEKLKGTVIGWRRLFVILGGICTAFIMAFGAMTAYVNNSNSSTDKAIAGLSQQIKESNMQMRAGFNNLDAKFDANRNERLQRDSEVRDDISECSRKNAVLEQKVQQLERLPGNR